MHYKEFFLLFLLIFTDLQIQSQPEIFITGQNDEQSFLVAHNGYLVYALPRKAFAIQLTTGDNLIQVLSLPDSSLAEKMIKLPDGKHKYTASKDRNGNLKLWYRGNYTQKPDSIPLYKAKPEFPIVWVKPEKTQKVLALENSNSSKKLSKDTLLEARLESLERLDENISAIMDHKDSIKTEVIAVNKIDTNATNVQQTVVEAIKSDSSSNEKIVSESNILEVLAKKEYEFDRLNAANEYIKNNPSTLKEISEIAATLKYDLTKIQFLKIAYQNSTEASKFAELTSVFEFEASKNQLIDFLKSNPK